MQESACEFFVEEIAKPINTNTHQDIRHFLRWMGVLCGSQAGLSSLHSTQQAYDGSALIGRHAKGSLYSETLALRGGLTNTQGFTTNYAENNLCPF